MNNKKIRLKILKWVSQSEINLTSISEPFSLSIVGRQLPLLSSSAAEEVAAFPTIPFSSTSKLNEQQQQITMNSNNSSDPIMMNYYNNFTNNNIAPQYHQSHHQNLMSTSANTTFGNHPNNLNTDFNISQAHIDDFIRKLQELTEGGNRTTNYQLDNQCTYYCNGYIRDMLLGYKSIHGYISLLICIFGTIANILNIIVLTRKDMSKTPINTILKWLAVADMFVLVEYIPFSTYMYLIFPGRRDFKYSWAVYLLFHMHFTQILHTISISLTVTLAIWRYIAIKHPHGSIASFILSHCNEAILLSFIISPILCLPTYFVFKINETYEIGNDLVIILRYHLDANEDIFLYSFNFWVHSVLIKLLPCLILTVISFVLIQVLCQAAKRKVKLKGGYSQPSTTTDNNTTNVFVNTNGHRSSKIDRRTDRTTMLLVAVLLLFLITEFPQGILGLLSGILAKCFFIRCYSLFGELMDLLALINAAVGFVLYGLMSKQFRTSFISVFFKTRRAQMEMTKVTGINNTTCV